MGKNGGLTLGLYWKLSQANSDVETPAASLSGSPLRCDSWDAILHIKQEGFLDLALDCLCLPSQTFSGLRLWVHQDLYGHRLPVPLFPGATSEEGTP